MRNSSLWNWLLSFIAFVSVPAFAIWIGIELYFAATTTDRQEIEFRRDLIVSVIQGASLLYLGFTLAKNWEMASAANAAAEASRETLREMRDARDDETAPYVIAYFDIAYGDSTIHFIIKNIGQMPARNIRLKFSPPIKSSNEIFAKYSPIINGIPSLAPGQELKTFFGGYIEHNNANLPKTYEVKVSYKGGIIDKEREDVQVLDISMYEYRMYENKKDIDDLVKVTEKVLAVFRDLANERRSGASPSGFAPRPTNLITPQDDEAKPSS